MCFSQVLHPLSPEVHKRVTLDNERKLRTVATLFYLPSPPLRKEADTCFQVFSVGTELPSAGSLDPISWDAFAISFAPDTHYLLLQASSVDVFFMAMY